MKKLLRLSLVLLAFATTGLFAQTAPTPSSPAPQPTKVVKKGHKRPAKHKKKQPKKHAKKS